MLATNPILDTDSYKASHYLQYPQDMTKLVAYVESRGGRYPATLFFGLQYILKKSLSIKITKQMVDEVDSFLMTHGLPFNRKGWLYIATKLQGRLPLSIFSVSEGSLVPTNNILMRIESTDPQVPWIVTWFETQLLRVWYPTTVATHSFFMKKSIFEALQASADDPENEIVWKLHDFGSRGVSSAESAGIGGAAHLINFWGSDTIEGVKTANTYYQTEMAGFSIPAAEHSTIITWGPTNESAAYAQILKVLAKPKALLAIVIDSYNPWQALDTIFAKSLKQQIIDSDATIVIRTDSGNPLTVVPRTITKLARIFGTTVNTKGYRVLRQVRVIHGDQITPDKIQKILAILLKKGFSASNVTFGIGGELLQRLDRDTLQFAYKVCEVTTGTKSRPVAKLSPLTPMKQSQAGYLDLIKHQDTYATVVQNNSLPHPSSELQLVYQNGQVLLNENLETIRGRATSHLKGNT